MDISVNYDNTCDGQLVHIYIITAFRHFPFFFQFSIRDAPERRASQQRRDAAAVFRSRHHISHEDTICVGGPGGTGSVGGDDEFEDLTRELGGIEERPAVVSELSAVYFCEIHYSGLIQWEG